MRPGRADRRGEAEEQLPRTILLPALVRFFLLSLAAAVLLGLTTVAVADRIARSRALEDARQQGAQIASRLASPLVDADVRAGVPGATDRLSRALGSRMSDGTILHVKLWARNGQILWSDEPQIRGRRFELEDDVRELFGTTRTTATVSDLSDEENVAEQDEGRAVEVYAGTFDADGEPLVFEAYLPTDPMEENARAIVVAFVPLIVASLVLFLLVVMPLALSLSRRIERGERERVRLMRHAALASDLERRRLARDLHDGVVQELAGLGYSLPTVERQLRPDGDFEQARSELARATGLVQHNVQALRQLLIEIYPPDLAGPGLREAVHQLVTSEAIGAGLRPDVRVAEGLELPPAAALLAYRVVREGIQNVVKHAQASSVLVEMAHANGQVMIRVVDDGRGAGPAGSTVRAPEGHLGLRLLQDTVRDVGGSLAATSGGPGRGVSLVARFPVELPGS